MTELYDDDAHDVFVVELSSFQTAEVTTSPTVGVLTLLAPDHLDWHRGLENYYGDKLALFTRGRGPGRRQRLLLKRRLPAASGWSARVLYGKGGPVLLCEGSRVVASDLGPLDLAGFQPARRAQPPQRLRRDHRRPPAHRRAARAGAAGARADGGHRAALAARADRGPRRRQLHRRRPGQQPGGDALRPSKVFAGRLDRPHRRRSRPRRRLRAARPGDRVELAAAGRLLDRRGGRSRRRGSRATSRARAQCHHVGSLEEAVELAASLPGDRPAVRLLAGGTDSSRGGDLPRAQRSASGRRVRVPDDHRCQVERHVTALSWRGSRPSGSSVSTSTPRTTPLASTMPSTTRTASRETRRLRRDTARLAGRARASSGRCASCTSRPGSATSRPPRRTASSSRRAPSPRPRQAFVRDLYDKGLREFAVSNDCRCRFVFELSRRGVQGAGHAGSPAAPSQGHDGPPPGIAVPIGGGKDSIVLVEALKAARPPRDSPRGSSSSTDVRRWSASPTSPALPLASITRTLSPRLLELNAAGALNGHVPITAIVSLIVVAAGYVYGYDTVSWRSSARPTRRRAIVDEVPVNHQWSKSTECELGLRSVVRESVSSSIEYTSGLRSCGELEIARWFADLGAYHSGFRSCNRAYRPGGRYRRLVRELPQVPLRVPGAGAVPRARSSRGRSSVTTCSTIPTQVEGFWDLCASGRKPYECVGEQRESLLAFLLLLDAPALARRRGRGGAAARARGPAGPRRRRSRWRSPGDRERPAAASCGSCRSSSTRSLHRRACERQASAYGEIDHRWSDSHRVSSDSLTLGGQMILDSINSPADLKALSLAECDQLAGEIRDFIVEAVSQDRRPPRLEPRRRRAHARPAPGLRLPRGHPAVRHRPPGLRPQARDGPTGGFRRAQAGGRALGLPVAGRVRPRPHRELARLDRAQLRPRHRHGLRLEGQDEPGPRRAPRRGGRRRRCPHRRYGLRGAQQPRPLRRPGADRPQRQRPQLRARRSRGCRSH